MFKSLLTEIFIFFLFLQVFSYSQEINVCLWKGRNPQAVLPRLQNKYGGEFSIRNYGGESLIVNSVDIEKYLTGVLAKEMDSLWPIEALKAQAVLSRTFAVLKIKENRSKNLPYDIENSIYHQVYGVTDCEKIGKAVYETAGQILTDSGEIAQVFFHANCGGRTSTPEEVWGGTYHKLQSVEDPYCADTPYYNWSKTFTKAQVSRLVNFPGMDKITVSERYKSGRAKNLRLSSKNGKVVYMQAHKFRMAINGKSSRVAFDEPFIIPATNFTISQQGEKITFTGTGYGHGVGMCQWGARKMAEGGKSHGEILGYYFPNLVMETFYDINRK